MTLIRFTHSFQEVGLHGWGAVVCSALKLQVTAASHYLRHRNPDATLPAPHPISWRKSTKMGDPEPTLTLTTGQDSGSVIPLKIDPTERQGHEEGAEAPRQPRIPAMANGTATAEGSWWTEARPRSKGCELIEAMPCRINEQQQYRQTRKGRLRRSFFMSHNAKTSPQRLISMITISCDQITLPSIRPVRNGLMIR